MRISRLFLGLLCLSMSMAVPHLLRAQPANGINFKVLYTVSGNGVGGYPESVFEASKGIFYGVGGFSGGSTVFNFDAGGHVNTIYRFASGTTGYGLILAQNGALYGYGANNGAPEYFSMGLDGSAINFYPETIGGIGSFAAPAPNGYLYDFMASSPNLYLGRIDLAGHASVAFQSTGIPESNLVRDAYGNFYGVMIPPPGGGTQGSVFRVNAAGQYTQLATFDETMLRTGAWVLLGSDGNLYVTLAAGGKYRRGSIFRVTPGGQMTTIIEFPRSGIAGPDYLVEASDGYIYGSNFQSPTYIYRFDPASPKLEPLAALSGAQAVGAYFVQGSDGKFYGSSPIGGTAGIGTLFSFDLGLTPPKPFLSLFSPTAAAPGTKILLWGRNLLGTTSVTFNGTSATSITGTTSYSVYVTVPAGATSGPITIATANGTYTTIGNFTIQ